MSNSATDPVPIPPCPRCSGTHVVRNGVNASGTPVFRCPACGRRFVAAPKKGPVGEPDRELVRRLLAERVGVRAIARVTGRSRSWVQGFVTASPPLATPKRVTDPAAEEKVNQRWAGYNFVSAFQGEDQGARCRRLVAAANPGDGGRVDRSRAVVGRVVAFPAVQQK